MVTIKSTGFDLINAQLVVQDMTGRDVQVNYISNSGGEMLLDCTEMAQGNYFVTVSDSQENKQVLKLSVKH